MCGVFRQCVGLILSGTDFSVGVGSVIACRVKMKTAEEIRLERQMKSNETSASETFELLGK